MTQLEICTVHRELCQLRYLQGWVPKDCLGLMDEGLVHLKRRKGWPEGVRSATMDAPMAEDPDCGTVIRMPEFEKTFDQERWEKMYPGKKWHGAAQDLACAQGPKVWKNYIPGKGPVIRNQAERREYMRLTGHRELERGENFGHVSPRERAMAEFREKFTRHMQKG